MRTKIVIGVVCALLAILLAGAWWRVREARQRERELLRDIRLVASANATHDWELGKLTYRITGLVKFPIVTMFNDRFRQHGITAIMIGDSLSWAECEYSEAYNRVVRERLQEDEGSDLIGQFMAGAYDQWKASRSNPRMQADTAEGDDKGD